MSDIEVYLQRHPFFIGLAPTAISAIAALGRNQQFTACRTLFYQDDPATTFFVIREGKVGLKIHRRAGRSVMVDCLGEADVVGWSWLVAPYRWMFDAVALQDCSVIAFDAPALRARCDEDPQLGYEILVRVTQVMHHRLDAARMRLLMLSESAYDPAK